MACNLQCRALLKILLSPSTLVEISSALADRLLRLSAAVVLLALRVEQGVERVEGVGRGVIRTLLDDNWVAGRARLASRRTPIGARRASGRSRCRPRGASGASRGSKKVPTLLATLVLRIKEGVEGVQGVRGSITARVHGDNFGHTLRAGTGIRGGRSRRRSRGSSKRRRLKDRSIMLGRDETNSDHHKNKSSRRHNQNRPCTPRCRRGCG
mmetsp:Transcript_39781/g.61153  ORF Transcript_39781/g.61153 Transcript_39781/m.61153 type:complete len:211 (+) Transcript_39781:12-644(+)